MQYVTDTEGKEVNGFRATEIRSLATKLCVQAAVQGIAPLTWGKAGREMEMAFSTEICRTFPEMGLCDNNWKVTYMMTKMYSSWHRTYFNTKSIKVEAPDDAGTKRPNDGALDKASKRTKVEIETPIELIPAHVDVATPLPPVPVSPTPTTPAFTVVNPLFGPPTAVVPIVATTVTVPVVAAEPITTTPPVGAAAAEEPSPNTSGDSSDIATQPAKSGKASKGSKESKATPGSSTTPRNLCMIAWSKSHPGGLLSQFKLHWAAVEADADKLKVYSSASLNAAESKTKYRQDIHRYEQIPPFR
ncbi:hypothetical protein C8R46DRAFT_1203207 [Mycena filopes]|nr:hypothetical protein C8R46DRAFT_1203207 [Mycena filopes]